MFLKRLDAPAQCLKLTVWLFVRLLRAESTNSV